MKPSVKVAIAFLFLLLIIYLFNDDSKKTYVKPLQSELESDSSGINEASISNETANVSSIDSRKNEEAGEVDIKSVEEEIENLKSEFHVTEDEFSEITIFSHKNIGIYWPNRKTVYTKLSNEGAIVLYSHFHADDWLFHTQVIFRIDDKNYETDVVETYSESHRTNIDKNGGGIHEDVRYPMSDDLIKILADNYQKPIKVRFNGRQFYDDIELSTKDKIAIKESWELASLYRKISPVYQ